MNSLRVDGFRRGILTERAWLQEGGTIGMVKRVVAATILDRIANMSGGW